MFNILSGSIKSFVVPPDPALLLIRWDREASVDTVGGVVAFLPVLVFEPPHHHELGFTAAPKSQTKSEQIF